MASIKNELSLECDIRLNCGETGFFSSNARVKQPDWTEGWAWGGGGGLISFESRGSMAMCHFIYLEF